MCIRDRPSLENKFIASPPIPASAPAAFHKFLRNRHWTESPRHRHFAFQEQESRRLRPHLPEVAPVGHFARSLRQAPAIRGVRFPGPLPSGILRPRPLRRPAPDCAPSHSAERGDVYKRQGSGFVSGSTVTYNNLAHTTTYAGESQLTISLTPTDLATAGSYPVVVTNPTPGGGASAPVNFNVVTGTPTGAFTITVTATSGPLTHSATFTLNVNP